MNEHRIFSWDSGIQVQQQQIIAWKRILKEEFHKQLDDEAERQNKVIPENARYEDDAGHLVWRGTSIDNFVLNIGSIY